MKHITKNIDIEEQYAVTRHEIVSLLSRLDDMKRQHSRGRGDTQMNKELLSMTKQKVADLNSKISKMMVKPHG